MQACSTTFPGRRRAAPKSRDPGGEHHFCGPWVPRAPDQVRRLAGKREKLEAGAPSAYDDPMSNLPPVRPVTLAEIEAARERIRGTALRAPLVKTALGPSA